MASDNMILAAAFASGVAHNLKPINDFNDVPLVATVDVMINGIIYTGLTKCLLKFVDERSVVKRTFLYYTLSLSSVYFLYDSVISDMDFDVDYDIDNE